MRTAAIALLIGLLTTVLADDKKPRLDLHNDPLPDGAIARLGSARLRHGEAVSFTAFLPDGKTLVSAGADWNIRIWNIANGQEIKQLTHSDDAEDRKVPVRRPGRNSPLLACLSADGKVMATCAVNSRHVRVWDLEAGKTVKTITPGVQSVNAIGISPDGKTLAVSMSDATIRIIETATGKELRSVGRENQPMGGFSFSGGFSGLRFSPDNKTLVLMGMEFDNGMLKRSLRAWDATTGKLLYRTEADAQRTLFGSTPSFSPDGKMYVLSTYQGDLHLLEAATGKEVRVIKTGLGRIDSAVFSNDGKQVIARGMNESGTGIWDASNGKEVKIVGKAAPGNIIRTRFSSVYGVTGGISLSPDGKTVAVPEGNQVRLIDLTTGKDVFASSGHRGAIHSLQFVGDGKTLLSQSLDGTLRLWDPLTGKETGEVKVPTNAYVVHLSPDAKMMAVEGTDGVTRIVQVETGKELHKIPQAQPMRMSLFAFSGDNKRLAMRSRTENVTRVFSVETGKEIAVLGKPDPAPQPFRSSMRNSAMAFSPDGTVLAAPGSETGLVLWDIADASMRREIAIPANVQLRDVVFSRDGRLLALDLGDNRAIVHEIASGLERHRFTRKGEEPVKEPIQEVRQVFFASSAMQANKTLTFSHDGKRLALATEGRVVHVWDAMTGEDLGKKAGHQGEVSAIAFSPDGKFLATGGEDAIGLVWDLTTLKSVKNPVAMLNPGDLETRWNALYTADAAGAFKAIADLTSAPASSVAFLDKQLKLPEDVNADVIDRLIVDLDARRFPTRKKAQDELEKIGAKAIPALKKSMTGQASEEIKKRAKELLDKLQGATLTPPQLQTARAIEVLERIGTTEAKAVLERLSKGPVWALETMESKAALERLK